MTDRPYLGISFRWVREVPDTGVVRDAALVPHSAVFVMNHGTVPAVNVRFAGALRWLDGVPTLPAPFDLSASDEQVCQPTMGGGLPLWYQLHGDAPTVTDAAGALYAFGRVEYTLIGRQEPVRSTEFCAVWKDRFGWQNVRHTAT